MDESLLIARVSEHGGLRTRSEVMRAIRGTLVALGERLEDGEREAFARELPPELAPVLERAAYAGDFDRDEFFARVARHEGLDRGFAAEHAQVVCGALGALLSDEAITRLRKELGASIAELFDAPDRSAARDREPSARGSTLASGRPGSRHPISEASSDLAHSQSPARASNPHADTKLSSAHGLKQEQLGKSLATGRPDSARSIAETKR